MTSERPPASSFPASMGPVAQTMGPRENAQSMIRNIKEMRSHYHVTVEPTVLKVSYRINNSVRSYDIPFDTAPVSGFRRWLCYGGSGRAKISGTFLLDMMRGAENMSGQPLTQREAEGFTFHSAKRMEYGFTGMFFALASGYGMAAWGAKQMKFPFKKPKPLENYDAFPMKRMPLLTGNYARLAWQTTRANIYAALGVILLSPVFRAMGESVMAVGLYRDERTREKVKAIKGGFDRIQMNRQSQRVPQQQPQPSQQTDNGSDTGDYYARGDASTQSSYGGSTDYEGDSAFSESAIDTGTLSDSAARQRESKQSAPSAYGADRQPRNQTYQQPQSQPQSSSSSSRDFFFDDASPTAGNDPDPAISPPYQRNTQSRNGGSMWDRIRRGGQPNETQRENSTMSTSSPQQRPNQSGGWRRSSVAEADPSASFETKGDSFSFSSTESDRALAKEQAQREFDNMLERERKESGSGDYDRGSYAAGTDGGSQQSGSNSGVGSAWDRTRRRN